MDASSLQVMPFNSYMALTQEESTQPVKLAPWQTYRENTDSFLQRQRSLREIYSEQKKRKETSNKPRWAKSYEPGLFTSGRQCTFSWSVFKNSQNSAHTNKAAYQTALESFRAPDQTSSNGHQPATTSQLHSNVALLPVMPAKSTIESDEEFCISPNLTSLNECVTFAGWPQDSSKLNLQRETHRSHSEFPPIHKVRPHLDVPLATSPRRGMLEITVPQLSRDKIHELNRMQDRRKNGLPILLKMERHHTKEVARPIRFSDLDESLTFGDVESAASALCDRKMKLYRSTTNDFNAHRRAEATPSK